MTPHVWQERRTTADDDRQVEVRRIRVGTWGVATRQHIPTDTGWRTRYVATEVEAMSIARGFMAQAVAVSA